MQGPTAVLPGACYFSTDRAGFMQSEEQLSPELLPPPALGDDDAWDTRVRRHMREVPSLPDLEERDRCLNRCPPLLGGETVPVGGLSMFEERKLVVPAGTFVVCHHDTFHRATRNLVSCNDIAAIWVAFFSRWQRYRC